MGTDEIKSCRETWEIMTQLTGKHGSIRNFQQTIRMDDFVVETELFPIEALMVYSAWNLEQDISEENIQAYFSDHRGGSQGDYRAGMKSKLSNVVDCLKKFPESKRAVLTIPNTARAHHSPDVEAKCMREIHFYIEGDTLNATVLFRAQAAEIFPKNIHFIGSMLVDVASKLKGNLKPGVVYYLATTLVGDRS